MARHILRLEEFECSNRWYCAATAEIGKLGNKWYVLPYALKMTPYEFVEMLANTFHPDELSLLDGPNGSVLAYSWKSQTAMRKYKNWINAQLRKQQFFVE